MRYPVDSAIQPLNNWGLARVAQKVDNTCLVPRRLSLDENVRAKEGGKETTGETAGGWDNTIYWIYLYLYIESLLSTTTVH